MAGRAICGLGLQAECRCRKGRFSLAQALIDELAQRRAALRIAAANPASMLGINSLHEPRRRPDRTRYGRCAGDIASAAFDDVAPRSAPMHEARMRALEDVEALRQQRET